MPTYKRGEDPLTAFEVWIKNMPRAELGGLIKEYVAESNHQGWDCWSRFDLTGIRKFFDDVKRYHDGCDPKEFATEINNVNPVP